MTAEELAALRAVADATEKLAAHVETYVRSTPESRRALEFAQRALRRVEALLPETGAEK